MGSVEANNSQVASSSLPEEASPTLDQVASSSMADQHDVIVVSSESDMEPDDVIDSQVCSLRLLFIGVTNGSLCRNIIFSAGVWTEFC